jgi:hypothetical protein
LAKTQRISTLPLEAPEGAPRHERNVVIGASCIYEENPLLPSIRSRQGNLFVSAAMISRPDKYRSIEKAQIRGSAALTRLMRLCTRKYHWNRQRLRPEERLRQRRRLSPQVVGEAGGVRVIVLRCCRRCHRFFSSQSRRNNGSRGDYRGYPSESLPVLWRVGLRWHLEGSHIRVWERASQYRECN